MEARLEKYPPALLKKDLFAQIFTLRVACGNIFLLAKLQPLPLCPFKILILLKMFFLTVRMVLTGDHLMAYHMVAMA